jgi:hypothetical protein
VQGLGVRIAASAAGLVGVSIPFGSTAELGLRPLGPWP